MLQVEVADISSLDVDVIVNAANNSLLGGGGVDGAIHRAAGADLLAFNRELGGCETGQVKVSPGFNLRAKWIIHTVGPVWQGGESGEAELLASCYRLSFEQALKIEARSIAFPAISCGVYGYPKKSAAIIAVTIMQNYEAEFERVIACCFSEQDADIYRDLIRTGI